METMFFDLPLDLREVVYRRARFMEARQRIGEFMKRRSIPMMIESIFPEIKSIEVEISIHSTKKLRIIRCEKRTHLCTLFDRVEIFNDDCGVRVVLHVKFDNRISLFIGTQRRETYFISYTSQIKNLNMKQQNFCFAPDTVWTYINENKNAMILATA